MTFESYLAAEKQATEKETARQRPRLDITKTLREIIGDMSDGNPGCITFLCSLLKNYRHGNPIEYIKTLDYLDIYGSKAYMLWNDCCGRDIEKVELVLQNYSRGYLYDTDIYKHIDGGRGEPFEGLKDFEYLKRHRMIHGAESEEW
jgi:hypothetical protein